MAGTNQYSTLVKNKYIPETGEQSNTTSDPSTWEMLHLRSWGFQSVTLHFFLNCDSLGDSRKVSPGAILSTVSEGSESPAWHLKTPGSELV